MAIIIPPPQRRNLPPTETLEQVLRTLDEHESRFGRHEARFEEFAAAMREMTDDQRQAMDHIESGQREAFGDVKQSLVSLTASVQNLATDHKELSAEVSRSSSIKWWIGWAIAITATTTATNLAQLLSSAINGGH